MNAITEAQSIEQVVEIINAAGNESATEYFGGSDTRSAEAMAGQWAFEAADEAGYTENSDIEAQLNILSDAGADFDFSQALADAIGRRKESE